MLKPGSLTGDTLEVGSMAEAIEQAMVALGVLDLDAESPDAATTRRNSFIAISTGVINHLKANLEIDVAVGKFGPALPAAATQLLGSSGEVK
jgi:hypothetical protein